MIKPLYKYIIPGIFNQRKEMKELNMYNLGFFQDLDTILDKFKIEITISNYYFETGEKDVIDLGLELENTFQGNTGEFYITWSKDTLECISIWFSGLDENEEPIFQTWDIKNGV